MRSAGFQLNVINGNKLEVKERRWIDDELHGLIATHKLALIQLLNSEANHA